MRQLGVLLLVLGSLFGGQLIFAQQYAPQPVPQTLDSVPSEVEALRGTAASKTEFTLDHSMLVFASKLDSNDDDLRRVIAGVSGLSVHRFHFVEAWMYDSDALHSIGQEYKSNGWLRLPVNNHEKDGGPAMTDVWLQFENNAISRIAILVARSNTVTFIQIAGSISPLDLSHLGGHFGIPKIEGGVEVPRPTARR